MDLSVHIVDPRSETLVARFEDLGVNVDQSHDDHFALYNTYHDVFGSFHRISTANMVLTSGKVTPNNALEILYTILKNKPVIAIGKLSYTADVDSFTRELIDKASSRFSIKDVTNLDKAELKEFLTELAKHAIDYGLELHQKALVRARVRTFFREAVSPSVAA